MTKTRDEIFAELRDAVAALEENLRSDTSEVRAQIKESRKETKRAIKESVDEAFQDIDVPIFDELDAIDAVDKERETNFGDITERFNELATLLGEEGLDASSEEDESS